VLVRLQCHHVEEERLIIASAAVANSHLGFVARLDEWAAGIWFCANIKLKSEIPDYLSSSLIMRRKFP
jgi:hypothetical protein